MRQQQTVVLSNQLAEFRRRFEPVEGLDVQKTKEACLVSKIRRHSCSNCECQPLMKLIFLEAASRCMSSKLINSRSRSICRAEMSASSGRRRISALPTPQSPRGCPRKIRSACGGSTIFEMCEAWIIRDFEWLLSAIPPIGKKRSDSTRFARPAARQRTRPRRLPRLETTDGGR